ncbi:PTS glucose transporter subunit IIA [Ammoniphilus sp. 3BR4]
MSRKFTVLSPLSGKVLKLEEVPDPIFLQKLMGDGLAIKEKKKFHF